MLTFEELSKQNSSRASRWHPGFPVEDNWNGADWSNALAGETGEACNIVKKIRRLETNKKGRSTEMDMSELIYKLSDELADVVIYANLVAIKFGINLGNSVKNKFNQTSEFYEFPERL